MVGEFLALMLAPTATTSTANAPQAAIVALEAPESTGIDVRPRIVVLRSDRIAAIPPPAGEAQLHHLAVRVSSPAGLLWQGNIRVALNQGANYSQSFSQASPVICPPNSPYDRSDRSSVNFNVYVQNNGYGTIYRVDASWQRPTEETGCGERGTRTVQVSKGLSLDPGESGMIEGDAGLRVEVTRQR
jgi:hypothetical protein